MVAWANREALARDRPGRAGDYWSRSRRALWRKGDTSGHVQEVRAIALDCDGDAVLYVVRQDGPGLPHRHAQLLLGETGDPMADERFLAQLWATIESRKADDGAGRELHPAAPRRTPRRSAARSSRKRTR